MKSVACRIASRPSPHLTFPTPCVNKADIDALGVAANGAASTGPAMSTASACGDVDAAAERDLKSGGNGLARAGNGAGVPENVTVGTQARERKDYAADDVDADIGMADAPAMRPSIDITSDTLAAGNRATFEPGTPSDPEDFLMDEVRTNTTLQALNCGFLSLIFWVQCVHFFGGCSHRYNVKRRPICIVYYRY